MTAPPVPTITTCFYHHHHTLLSTPALTTPMPIHALARGGNSPKWWSWTANRCEWWQLSFALLVWVILFGFLYLYTNVFLLSLGYKLLLMMGADIMQPTNACFPVQTGCQAFRMDRRQRRGAGEGWGYWCGRVSWPARQLFLSWRICLDTLSHSNIHELSYTFPLTSHLFKL